jgi:hypothetical protein
MDPEPQPADSLVDLLDQLQDVLEPPPVSMVPATWGWAVLALLLLGAAALAAWAWLRHRRATAYRRAALAELHALAPALERGDPDTLAALERLLRRTALAAFPRAEVATLTGDAWLAFLDRTGGGFAGFGPALAAAPYAPAPPAVDGRAVLRAARHWIAHHHA